MRLSVSVSATLTKLYFTPKTLPMLPNYQSCRHPKDTLQNCIAFRAHKQLRNTVVVLPELEFVKIRRGFYFCKALPLYFEVAREILNAIQVRKILNQHLENKKILGGAQLWRVALQDL